LTEPKTLFDKVWDRHVVAEENGQSLLYIDLHLVHEVTSPQAFEGLRLNGRSVRRPGQTFATMDHNVPTLDSRNVRDGVAKKQIDTLVANCREFGIRLADMDSPHQGIVHVIGPELGLTLPGKTIVCGDSHTSTHGAFGAMAFGIGTSEVEHVLATQCLWQKKPKTMKVEFQGLLPFGVSAKDAILYVIARHGIGFGAGYAVEFAGEAVREMTMEQRMTLCNMAIEGGARLGMVAPDETTFAYVKDRQFAPEGADYDACVQQWRALASDAGATYQRVIEVDVAGLEPQVTWGTNPSMCVPISGCVPPLTSFASETERKAAENAYAYMDLKPGTPIEEIAVHHVFIGSCTNARMEDLRMAAKVVQGRRVKAGVSALVVPGSRRVKEQAEAEGLDEIFRQAGFQWREPGCSMCLAMNPDVVPAGERCASTSNRNFEGRQGRGARTHLVSPAMAAAAAIHGHFVDVRRWLAGDGEGGTANGAAHTA